MFPLRRKAKPFFYSVYSVHVSYVKCYKIGFTSLFHTQLILTLVFFSESFHQETQFGGAAETVQVRTGLIYITLLTYNTTILGLLSVPRGH